MTRPPDWPDHALAWFKGLKPAQKVAISEVLKESPDDQQRFGWLVYTALDLTTDERNEQLRNTEGVEVLQALRRWASEG